LKNATTKFSKIRVLEYATKFYGKHSNLPNNYPQYLGESL